ncbi:MAG: glycoside hydrolase family 32 protein [Saprospiraceae bacterium]|nr:glycoside hydrolase family 32 protein [Saprospiraceae bacterium]
MKKREQMMNRLLIYILPLVLFSCKQATTQYSAEAEQTAESSYYMEDHRPQFHFSPEKMWMNDPNGMVYFDGEYHLFYQHYPDSNVWGPMHWGHSVSQDLVLWEHLPIALYPDSLGYIFSGSAVIDHNNTSGFGTAEQPPMIAIFTHHHPEGAADEEVIKYQYQSIASSTDRGRTWTKYEGNPVVANPGIRDFRDPKVIWDDDSQQWVMIFAAYDHSKIYGSPDLKSWQHLSDFGKNRGIHSGVWECPDLFPITVAGTSEKRWVLIQSINPGGPKGGSATQYFVGDFDGKKFSLDKDFEEFVKDENAVWLEYGKDNYAGVTWSDIPDEDGRRLFMGWMSNWEYAQVVPTYVWRSAMTIPRQLVLSQTEVGLRIASQPVDELKKLRIQSVEVAPGPVERQVDLLSGIQQQEGLYEIEVEFENTGTGDIAFVLSNQQGESLSFGFESDRNHYYVDRSGSGKVDFSEKFSGKRDAPRISSSERLTLHCFIDVASIEIFADGGLTVMTEIFFPNEVMKELRLEASEGLAVVSGSVHALRRIW